VVIRLPPHAAVPTEPAPVEHVSSPPVHRARVAVLLMGLLLLGAFGAPARAAGPVVLEYFWAEGCPYCAQQAIFLDDLEQRFGDDLVVERYEVSGDPAARDRWVDELAARGQQASGVPTTILGDQVWVGFDERAGQSILQAVEVEVAAVQPTDDPDPPDDDGNELGPPAPEAGATTIDLPLVGEVKLAGRSAIGTTALIALVDGFNPCSLWVLTVLLAMVVNAGASRGRVALVGGTFLTVTGLIYGAFIAGVFSVLGFVEHLSAIRIAVAILALVIGAINVKDYVAFKRGPSLTIPDRFKPRIYRAGRAVRDPSRSLPAVVGVTAAMAVGIALVELPCTAGFPVIWTGIMRSQEVAGVEFAALLALYLLIYVLDELVLFAVVVTTLRIGRFQETHGRVLKLVGGAVMLALGVVLILAPELMDSLAGAALVVLGSIGLAVLIAVVHRMSGGEAGHQRTEPGGAHGRDDGSERSRARQGAGRRR
jgi:thiol-disulfide isomerase/thioredoxin